MINKSLEILINVSKQCGNNFLPEVLESNSLEEAITMTDNTSEIYSFDTEATEYFNQEGLGENSSITIITGPESGFSDKEVREITIVRKGKVLYVWDFLEKEKLRKKKEEISTYNWIVCFRALVCYECEIPGHGPLEAPWEGSWVHSGPQGGPRDEKYAKRA